MKLKIRYENEYQTIVLNEQDTEALWVSLSLEGEGLSKKEREQLIQDSWEVQFNRPDYNSWHKHDRHHGNTKAQVFEDDDTGLDGEGGGSWCEPLMSEVADDSIFRRDEIRRQQQWDDEEWPTKLLKYEDKAPLCALSFLFAIRGQKTHNSRTIHHILSQYLLWYDSWRAKKC